jgi:DNA-binding NarL/FixJ family response regulator
MPHPIRVFLVEDHPMTRAGLRLLLEQDARVLVVGEAVDGADALQQVSTSQLPPDVVLMDIGLPVMDGIEATQALKARRPSVRVLMLTSKDHENDVIAAMAAGADAYCMKGISAENLIAVIISVHEGAAWLDPVVARIVLGRFQGIHSGQSAAVVSEAMAAAAQTPTETQQKTMDCPLTTRELEVLRLIVDGLSNPEIADRLCITKATAKAHVHSILQKLCVDDRTQAAVLAMRQGYV